MIQSQPPACNRKLGLLQIHFAALLAGCTGLFGKLLDMNPFVIIAGRTCFGCLTLLLAAQITGALLRVRVRRDLLAFALSGLLLTIHWFSFFRAIQLSTVAIGLLAFSSFPLFVTFLEPLLFREKLRAFDVAAAVVILLGLAILTPDFNLANNLTQGVAWGVLSGFSYAILSLLSRSSIRRYAAISVAFYQQIFAALFSIPMAFLFRAPISAQSWWLLLALGVIFTGLGQTLFVSSLQHIRAQWASVILGLEPVYGIVLALLFLGEVPSPRTIFGGLLIASAVFGATRRHYQTAP